jgi:hypothetical protein
MPDARVAPESPSARQCLLRLIRPSPFLRPNRIPNWTNPGGQVSQIVLLKCSRTTFIDETELEQWAVSKG